MTTEAASQAQSLRCQARIKRGAALMAIESGEAIEAALLHQEAVAMEAMAESLEKPFPALATG